MALKLGAEDKKKVYIASGLGVVVLALVAWNLKDSFTAAPAPAAPPPVVAQNTAGARPSSVAPQAARLAKPGMNLDPTLHPELMAQAESLEYKGSGRNIFSLSSAPVDIPKVTAQVRPNIAQEQVATGPPPPPPPPAIDLKFFGVESRQGAARRAFFLKGDDVFVASEGEVVDHRYKVVRIAPTSAQVEDLPYANTQSLPLSQN